ncbi:thioredoxin domain-containing protein [Vallitalea okinawensis]|uniref:thioredoxin domain-containing protein n=1 Tax=Vallitalea okinawensis TaxID=2078660 RepID=UPI000CFC26C3|nr:thioredoxin domain-containing protein [Vallitalea okinawensis]
MKADKKSNRLINEKSPYLLQHAYNPVDWYSWSDEAFTKAKEEDKLVFLSIGYSTCHWCHVMEEESFEDDEVAEYLNAHYISIKVDREERPDIDSIYMNYCQVVTGHGGWPLTVFLTPDKKPVYAGTYFPKEKRYGVMGFMELLEAIADQWKSNKEKVIAASDKSIDILQRMEVHRKEELKQELYDDAYRYFENNFDRVYGGFGDAPKFPSPHQLMYLLRYYELTGEENALEMVEKTLEGMYKGGLFDHVGFGFARYSTDRQWLVPHFEKMLYDNALLMMTYSEAYLITKKDLYRELVERTATYIIRDMTDEEGGYHSAEDADSEGAEGTYYLWDKKEIEDILGPEDSRIYINYYNITDEGNFESRNIPNLLGIEMGELAEDKGLNSRLQEMNKRLLMHRERRVKPHKDDKILTSWNGLMIAAMAKAGRVLKDNDLIKSAERAFWFVEKKLKTEEGDLYTRYREGEAKHHGFLTGYTNLVWGLLELYEATFNINFLNLAVDYADKMLDNFWDYEQGGLFMYGEKSETMIVRPKEVYDGAMPSGNSVACYVLIRLSRLLDKKEYEEKAMGIIEAFSSDINKVPYAHGFLLLSKMYSEQLFNRVIISGYKCDETCQSMIGYMNEQFTPFTLLILNENEEIRKKIPYLDHYEEKEGQTTAYVCTKDACQEPVHDLVGLEKTIGKTVE